MRTTPPGEADGQAVLPKTGAPDGSERRAGRAHRAIVTAVCSSTRERITTDPGDKGLRCEPEDHLEDMIRELHADC